MKEKVNDLVTLHKAMKEKLKQHDIRNKSKLLPIPIPNKWSQMYCSEYFNAFEYLV